MDAELKTKWVAALRSGEIAQARGFLRDDSGGMCCLGVLCQIVGADFDDIATNFGDLGISHPHELAPHLTLSQRSALAQLNDFERKSFAEIADYIEQNIPAEPAHIEH